MKKIPVLLLSLFLLLPILIYLGNIADLPISRTVIIHLRDLVGMSATKETHNLSKKEIEKIVPSHAHIGLVEAWRNLSMSGFNDLLQIAATPEVIKTWQNNAGDFLNDPLYATAFFSSAWSFWQVQHDKLSLIAYYQPWIDVLLVMTVTDIEGTYKITTVGIIEPTSIFSASSVTEIAHELNQRLDKAEQLFQTAVENPAMLNNMLNSERIKKSQNNLQQYVNNVRNKLIFENSKNMRLAVLEWLDTVQHKQIKELQEYPETERNWLKQLQIIQFIKLDTENYLLAAIDSEQTERVLIAQLQINEHKAQTKNLKIWDAATQGITR